MVPGGLRGREPEKKSSSVNSYRSNLILDFWKGTVIREIVELPLKDLMYRYRRQTYTSKCDLKEFNTNPFTLSPCQGPGQKLCGVSHSPDTDGTRCSREMEEKLLSALFQLLVCHCC